MKIYLAHSTGYDYENELYKPLLQLLSDSVDIYFPHDEKNAGHKSKDIIATSDLVIAEVSYPSTGQGIELGWADDNNIPIVCLYRTGSKISDALRNISDQFVEYSSAADMENKVKTILQSADL